MSSSTYGVRLGVRMLVRSPGLSAIAITAFALGIGLTTATFSIVQGVMLRGLPFEKSEQLVHLEESNLAAGINSIAVPIHDFVDWRAQQTSFVDLAAFYEGTVNLAAPGERAERYAGAFTTASLFDLVRVRATLGRALRAEDERAGAPPVVVLGYTVWRNRFDADPTIIGRTIRVNGSESTIVGVMPDGFRFPVRQDIWVPLRLDPLAIPRGDGTRLEVFGRLRDGIALDQAYAQMATVAKRLETMHPDANRGVAPLLKPYTHEFIGPSERALFLTMLGAVFGVLLIACANVANLLLARAVVRSREVAIRSALGATRRRVIGQLLVEAVVLSAVGGAVGLAIAFGGVAFFNDAMRSAIQIPFWIDVRVDLAVVAFTLGLTTIASLLAGVLPAMQASGVHLGDVLKDEGRGSSSFRLGRFSRGLVVAEVALSCALLAAAGMMVKSVTNLKRVDFGIRTKGTFTARVDLPADAYPDSASRLRAFDEVTARLRGIPGVGSIALASALPLTPAGGEAYEVEGEPAAGDGDGPTARSAAVSPEFFATFGTALTRGRAFGAQDHASSLPVTIVNESFARRHFSSSDPIGRRLRIAGDSAPGAWRTIVGVVPDMYMDGVRNQRPAGFYVPLSQAEASAVSIVIATGGAPLSLAAPVRDAVASFDSDLPIYDIRTMDEVVALSTWFYGTFGTLFTAFGLAALFLAAIGLYGVMSFSVGRRTQEMGIRLALGARPVAIMGLVLRQGLTQLGIGLAIGIALALLLSRGLAVALFDVDPADPTVFASIVAILVVSGVAACLVPALRATRVEPASALRGG